ncbi:H-NS histone family protein [Cupriavidus metallidurans]|nr:H-NS histone family protein [Cupriavidus metallidurans]
MFARQKKRERISAARGPDKRSTRLTPQRALFIHLQTGQSWSGHGRCPKWLTENRERSRIVGF